VSKKKNNSWPEIGIITKNEVKDKDGNVVRDEKGNVVTKLGFRLAEGITILKDGQPVNTSGYGVLKTPIEEVQSLIKNGVINESDSEKKLEAAKDIHTWLRYKIQLTPPRSQK
jgi:hypothetical protein